MNEDTLRNQWNNDKELDKKLLNCTYNINEKDYLLNEFSKIRKNRHSLLKELKVYFEMIIDQNIKMICGICNFQNSEYFKFNFEDFRYDI